MATGQGADNPFLLDFVPTPRQVAAGHVAAAPTTTAAPVEEAPTFTRPHPIKRTLETIRMLDPRAIAAGGYPIAPLMVFALLMTVGTGDVQVFGALLATVIRADLKVDLSFVGSILTVITFGTFMAAPIAVWMVRIGTALTHLSYAGSALVNSPLQLAGTQLAASIGPGIAQPAQLSLLTDYYPVERRARVFGFLQLATALGRGPMQAGIIVAILVLNAPWRPLLFAVGGLGVLASIGLFFIRDPLRGALDRKAMGASDEAAEREQKPVGWVEAWRRLYAIQTLRRIWFATPFLYMTQLAMGVFVFVLIQQRIAQGSFSGLGADILQQPWGVPVLVALPTVIAIALVVYSVPLAERLLKVNPGKILVLAGAAQAVQAVMMLSILVVPSLFLVFVCIWIASAFTQVILPSQQVVLSTIIPARVRGQGMQTIGPFYVIGSLGLTAVGHLGTQIGPEAALIALVPVALIGALLTASAGANVEADMRAAMAASMADEELKASRLRGRAKMIICRGLEVRYEGAQVLADLDFDVEEGEIVALLGTNGAGKSTLLRSLVGIQEVSNGAVFLDGQDVTHRPPHMNARDGIVFLPGGRAIFPTLSVEENLKAAGWLYRDEPGYLKERTQQVLEFFPVLRERLGTQAGNMSGGEQQQLALAQAFLMRPRLLMIDELSLGLAPAIVERLLDVVRAIHEAGTTVILVEQSVNIALTIADRAVFMDKGEIRFDGQIDALLGQPDLVRSVFLGGTGSGALVSSVGTTAKVEQGRAVLSVEDVHLGYGGFQALAGAHVEVTAGEVVGVIGPNGAGKTSLFDVISGFTMPDRGRVTIDGVDAGSSRPDERARLGLARSFQDSKLFPALTVRENLAVALNQRIRVKNPALAAVWMPQIRSAERGAFRRVDYLVDLFGLGKYANKFGSELSTGTKRFVELACASAAEPKVLLLDEPSSGLAQAEVELLGDVVRRIASETGCGILVIEHDLNLITQMADRLVAMQLGAVIAEGNPTDVIQDPVVAGSYLSASKSVIGRSGDVIGRALAAIGATE
jgi:branched-chain amino acid transport system ATP-binding protein